MIGDGFGVSESGGVSLGRGPPPPPPPGYDRHPRKTLCLGEFLGVGDPPTPPYDRHPRKICDGIMLGVSRVSGVGFRGDGVRFLVTEKGLALRIVLPLIQMYGSKAKSNP